MRSVAVVLSFALLAGCAHFAVPPASDEFRAGRAPNGRLVLTGDLAVARVEGTPEEIGSALASLCAEPLDELLSSWSFVDTIRSVFVRDVSRSVLEQIPADHRLELERLADEAHVDRATLLRANAVADTCLCTAFVASGAATRDGSTVVGRNLDFLPADLLGRTTLVLAVRPRGKKAFVSIGWPGLGAVVSGMNEDGLCASILINEAAGPLGEGPPLGFVVRRLLEECATVAEAERLFRACPPASDHLVLLADPHASAVVHRDGPWRSPVHGLLSCSNGPVETDARAVALGDLLGRNHGAIDADVARRILGATFRRRENVQAMVFEPARRRLLLARGTTFAPAALGDWSALELGPVFASPRAAIEARRCSRVAPFTHYTQARYRVPSLEGRSPE